MGTAYRVNMEDDSNPIRLKLSTFQYAANDPCEDTLVVEHDEAGLYVGVFDGHGGDPVSQMCAREAHGNFKDQLRRHKDDPGAALSESFLDLDQKYLGQVKNLIREGEPTAWRKLGAGSCAIVAHLNKGS